MAKYKHVLALNPYFAHTTAVMGLFPPTGLEYIAASMKDLVGKVTLLDLRYEKVYQDPATLSAFIRRDVDLVRQHPLAHAVRQNLRLRRPTAR